MEKYKVGGKRGGRWKDRTRQARKEKMVFAPVLVYIRFLIFGLMVYSLT